MILDNIKYLSNYIQLIPSLSDIKNYLETVDVNSLELGKNEVNESIAVIKIHYLTKPYEERFCEVHEKFLDLHLIISGNEKIGVQERLRSNVLEYVEEQDYAEAKAELKLFEMNEGDFMILFPHEVHATGIANKDISEVNKLVFKIPL